MEDFQPPQPNATSLPSADVNASSATNSVEYEAYPVRKPEEDLNDFKVQVRASTLSRCRTKLTQVSNSFFPWYEVLFAISMLTAGAFFGALPNNDIKTSSWRWILFFTILPVVAVASFVAYCFLRRSVFQEPRDTIISVLKELPDPDKTR